MRTLRYSRSKVLLADLAGVGAYLLAAGFFRLPDLWIDRALGFLSSLTIRFGGESPASRAITDLRAILARNDASAATMRRLLTESRAVEVRCLVRGAVLRSLP